jgi:hypothetical protein
MVSLLRIDNSQVFMTAAEMIDNSDGSVSFRLQNGQFGGQEPNQYGVRNDNADNKQYQRASLVSDTAVVFQPLPDSAPFMYILVNGTTFPA